MDGTEVSVATLPEGGFRLCWATFSSQLGGPLRGPSVTWCNLHFRSVFYSSFPLALPHGEPTVALASCVFTLSPALCDYGGVFLELPPKSTQCAPGPEYTLCPQDQVATGNY